MGFLPSHAENSSSTVFGISLLSPQVHRFGGIMSRGREISGDNIHHDSLQPLSGSNETSSPGLLEYDITGFLGSASCLYSATKPRVWCVWYS